VLIKAVAGGGGKGMRRVEDAAEFQDALTSCKREAASSFGDDRVLIEKYILSPRHIEVQVFGDSHGNIVHLFERDCSLQRRHQKVIEEAPAPGMDEATREAVCAAAVKAAKAVDYEGAGTIEFIADASEGLRADRIWFMEMNTRLQVEHPVTEEITGQDLVEWQLQVASGEPLPKRQDELSINGWAMEARLYAEDPAKGFLPSIGPLSLFELPDHKLRVDTGVREGDSVTPHYDPMIAKLIAHQTDRIAAIKALRDACSSTAIWPVRTNAAFLVRCLDDHDFAAGNLNTGLIGDRGADLLPDGHPPDDVQRTAAKAVLITAAGGSPWRIGKRLVDAFETDSAPWLALQGLRVNGPPQRHVSISIDGIRFDVAVSADEESEAWVETCGDVILVGNNDGRVFSTSLFRAAGAASGAIGDGAVISPMPGRIIAVEVAAGASVTRGQKLVTLEAMKMEHTLTAPFDGIVAELNATSGAQVSEGALLVRVEARDAPD
jgi:3-methylcrotonyl-CoA carboxylase alpha subunit